MSISKDSQIGILGYGVEGRATVDYLIKNEYQNITVCDQNDVDVPQNIEKRCGTSYLENLTDFECVFRSPGIPFLREELQEYQEKGGIITSATKEFFRIWPGNIIGVTGTKGKGTTTALIYKILKAAGKKAFLGGNIGENPLTFSDKGEKDAIAVLELSSFQLQDLKKSPNIAVVLMITQEHLDHHKTVEEYVDAKKNIFTHQKNGDTTVMVTNLSTNQQLFDTVLCGKVEINTLEEIKNGFIKTKNSTISFVQNGAKPVEILSLDKVLLRGKHNHENIAAATAVAIELDIPTEIIKDVTYTYEGLPHRLQTIHRAKHTYIDDSFSTTPETSIAAIDAMNEPFYVILGGSDKGADYAELVDHILKNTYIEGVMLLGTVIAKKIENRLQKRKFTKKVLTANTMEEAIEKVYPLSPTTILLSPGAASFDLFKNYKERAKAFDKWSKKIDKI